MRRSFTTSVILALGAITALACGSGGSSSAGSGGANSEGKYTQTWTTGYGETSCDDWSGTMTSKQRWVAAADMLHSARRVDGHEELPADLMVDSFAGGVSNVCSASGVGGMSIAEIGAMLYLTEPDFKP